MTHPNETSLQAVRNQISAAILHRLDPSEPLSAGAQHWHGRSLLEISRSYLDLLGVSSRGLDRLTLAATALQFRSAGMGTTSDFSSILANVATKRLYKAYAENPGTFARWARRAPNAPNFKPLSVVQVSAVPDLLLVGEHGEFKYGTLKDSGETYSVATFGRIVSLSRQALVNDDLRAFDRLVLGYGAAAARLENRMVYAQLTGNANMSDGNALFSAAHANNGTGAGSALQFSALTAMRTAIRLQKGLQSEELNLAPAYLIVPASLEQSAYQLTSAGYVPVTQAAVSEFRENGRTSLEPIVEPVLDTLSVATWYAAANSGQVDTVEYCWLDGAEGPTIETQAGFETDGVSFKCRLDFATKAIDWRGLYRGVGS